MNDTISRQDAIDAMTNTLWHYPNELYHNLNKYEFAKGLAELGLRSVPPAEPRAGMWVESPRYKLDTAPNLKCPFCGNEVDWYGYTKYCGECGAKLSLKMEVEHETD